MVSRILRKPLDLMKQIVTGVITDQEWASLKYLIYSAHDTQVVNMMTFLTESKSSFNFVPYAGTVTFELMY